MHVVPRIMWQPEAFLDPQNAPKSFSAGASPQTTLGELTALPQKLPLATHCGSLQRSPRPPSWIQGVLLLRGEEGRGGERKGREGKRRGGEGRGGEGRGGESLPRLEITSGYALGHSLSSSDVNKDFSPRTRTRTRTSLSRTRTILIQVWHLCSKTIYIIM